MNWNYARYSWESIEKFGEYDILTYEEQSLEERFSNRTLFNRSCVKKPGSVGSAIKNVEIRIFDERDQALPTRLPG
jgi:hypothetical protein